MYLYRTIDVEAALGMLEVGTLHDWQAEIKPAVFQGEDLFLSVPTSGGKSLIFQLPAILEAGKALTLVISPLRALQRDQVEWLTARGVKAALLNSDLSRGERREILDNLRELCLLYLAPEQLSADDLKQALRGCNVERVAVDEAHVLPQAAPSFRKAYGEIGRFIQSLPYPPQIIACTATATPQERKTIIETLKMRNPTIYIQPLRRENLRLSVKEIEVSKRRGKKKERLESLLFHAVESALLDWNGNGSAIIYCPTVKRVEKLEDWLKGRDWSRVASYTGRMSDADRSRVQDDFSDGSVRIVVTTNAFGLGINKPDVRLVIHAGPPLTLGGYVQEIGRAGRDGQKAYCVLFYADAEFARNEHILRQSWNEEAVRRDLESLNALRTLLKSSDCMWCGIEEYYGRTSGKPCKLCCNCKAKTALGKS